MKRFGSAVLAMLLAATPLSAKAALVDFTFTFANFASGFSGTVTGVVRGLTDDATSSASSVEVLSNGVGPLGRTAIRPLF